jgi:hypothetical protein
MAGVGNSTDRAPFPGIASARVGRCMAVGDESSRRQLREHTSGAVGEWSNR